MSINCTHCGAEIADSAIDRDRQIATCGSCASLVDVRPQLEAHAAGAAPAEAKPRMRDPVSLPAGMAIKEGVGGDVLTITRRWLRTKHFILLVVFGALTAFASQQWASVGYNVPLLVGTIILGLNWLRFIPMFVNSTTIEATRDRITVRSGPFPSLLFPNRDVSRDQLKQLFARKFGALYEVAMELNDGTTTTLVRPLVSDEQALFVEQQLERKLGIVDFAVAGELGAPALPQPVKAAASGGIAATILAFGIAGAVGVGVFFMGSSKIEGGFTATGDQLGEWTIAPDRCGSGQRSGYFGVQLQVGNSASPAVRLIEDPVEGRLVIVQTPGGDTHRFTPSQCEAMDLDLIQTNTSYNDVWLMKGTAHLECPGFSGSVEFGGCH